MSKKETDSEQRGTPNGRTSVALQWSSEFAAGPKECRSDDFSHHQVSAAMFGRAWVDKYPSLRREGISRWR